MSNNSFFHKINEFILSERMRVNHKLLVFLVFLFFSAVLWFFTALNKEYQGKISYPVHYINFPKDKILINDLPNEITIKVKSTGYTLLKHKLIAKLKPIIFNIQSYSLYQLNKENKSDYYILTSFAKARVADQLGKDYSIIDILPDTLFLQFTDMAVKRVPVLTDIDVDCEESFRVHGQIVVQPDSIVVTGPGNILDTLIQVKTKKYTFQRLDTSLEKTIQLSLIKNVTFSKKKVKVVIPVKMYSENTFEISITKINVPDSLELLLFPEKVKVTFLLALSDYEKVRKNHFEFQVDYNTIKTSETNRIRVTLERYPEIVQNILFYPTSVEFLKERK